MPKKAGRRKKNAIYFLGKKRGETDILLFWTLPSPVSGNY